MVTMRYRRLNLLSSATGEMIPVTPLYEEPLPELAKLATLHLLVNAPHVK